MKFKKEYLILLLIIIALSIYLATRTKDQTHFDLPQPAQADSQKINRLVITRDGNTIELTKQDDRWSITPNGYPADDIKVRNMVKASTDLKITDLISESGSYDRYGLTDDKKINVRVFQDQAMVRNFDVGLGAPTRQHTFARLGDDPKVYQVRGHLNETFDQTIDRLRDLTVLSFEKEDITALAIEKDARSLELTRKEVAAEDKAPAGDGNSTEEQKQASAPATPQNQWQDPEGQPVDQPTVDRLLGDFSKFKCNSFMADNAAEALKTPRWTLTFKSIKGPHTLSVFQKQDPEANQFPASSSQSPYAFMIAKSKVETIEKELDKLLAPAPKAEQ